MLVNDLTPIPTPADLLYAEIERELQQHYCPHCLAEGRDPANIFNCPHKSPVVVKEASNV